MVGSSKLLDHCNLFSIGGVFHLISNIFKNPHPAFALASAAGNFIIGDEIILPFFVVLRSLCEPWL
jgi:hypothetical protein